MALPTSGTVSFEDLNTDGGLPPGTPWDLNGTFTVPSATLQYQSMAVNNAVTYTFAAVPLGSAVDRLVVVAVMHNAAGTTALSSGGVTVDGVQLAALSVFAIGSSDVSGETLLMGLFYGIVPAVASAGVVVKANRTLKNCAVAVYSCYGVDSVVGGFVSGATKTAQGIDVGNDGLAHEATLFAIGGSGTSAHTWAWDTPGATAIAGVTGVEFSSLACAFYAPTPNALGTISASSVATLPRKAGVSCSFLPRKNQPLRNIMGRALREYVGPVSFSELLLNRSAKPYAAYCYVKPGTSAQRYAHSYLADTPTPGVNHDGRTGRLSWEQGYNNKVNVDTGAASGTRLTVLGLFGGDFNGRQINFGDGNWLAIPNGVFDAKFGWTTHSFTNAQAATVKAFYDTKVNNYVMVEVR
jgi:hypothetical protein